MANNMSIVNSTLTLNSTVISGFSDETDALTFPSLDVATEKYGADGRMTVTSTGTKGGRVTVKLMPESQSTIFLSSLAEQQKNGASIVFNGTYVNHTTGASVSLVNGTLVAYDPFPTQGKGEIASMKYVMAFERVDGNLSSADFS